MAAERWVVLSKLRGEFVITDQAMTSGTRPDERLKKLALTPEFDAENHYTGLHELTVDIDIDNPQNSPLPGHIALEEARDIAESIASMIALSIGRPVTVESVSARYDYPEPEKHRLVAGASQTAAIAPPSLLDPGLLAVHVDRKTRRVIRWWARGMSAGDGVERLSALTTALDLLVGGEELPDAPTRTRKCDQCGYEQTLRPGLRERVTAYLTARLGYDEDTATEVYESRIDLAHGRSNLSGDDLRRFREHAELLTTAVRAGLAQRLEQDLPPTPQRLPFDLPSAVLDVEYTDPPES